MRNEEKKQIEWVLLAAVWLPVFAVTVWFLLERMI